MRVSRPAINKEKPGEPLGSPHGPAHNRSHKRTNRFVGGLSVLIYGCRAAKPNAFQRNAIIQHFLTGAMSAKFWIVLHFFVNFGYTAFAIPLRH